MFYDTSSAALWTEAKAWCTLRKHCTNSISRPLLSFHTDRALPIAEASLKPLAFLPQRGFQNSGSQPFQYCNPHIVVTSNSKIISLLLQNWNFATVTNRKVNLLSSPAEDPLTPRSRSCGFAVTRITDMASLPNELWQLERSLHSWRGRACCCGNVTLGAVVTAQTLLGSRCGLFSAAGGYEPGAGTLLSMAGRQPHLAGH